jgi:hypothetical protein
MSRNLLVFIFGIFCASCATTHPGNMAESGNNEVLISVERQYDLSDKHYIFYEYTIENKTPEWKDVQIVGVNFDGQDTEILTGDKLSSWIEGAELKMQASQYNQALLLGSIIAVGGVAAGTSHDSNVQVAGLTAMAGAAAYSAGSGISRAQNKANSGIKGENGTVNVPRTHVFVPSKVAPDSYIRRWVVVRAPGSADNKNKKVIVTGSKLKKAKLISNVRIDGTKNTIYSAMVDTVPEGLSIEQQ